MWNAAPSLAADSTADRNGEPSRPVALARILVGIAALLQISAVGPHLTKLLAPGAFRAPYAITPPIGAAWTPIMICLIVALAVAAIVGWHTRIALAGLAAMIALVLALDQQLYGNDLYLLALECFLLCFAGSGAALSLDARRRGGASDLVERWPVLLLKIQLSIVYAFTAIAKINPQFLRGEVMQAALRFEDIPSQLAVALSLVSIGVECFLAVALWFHVTRRTAMLVGFLLHSSFLVLLEWGPQLVAFELEMLALYVLFPGMRPGEYVVVYDVQSPFIRTAMKWCLRLDWLHACRFADHETAPSSIGLEVVHGAQRFSGFEAVRELANVLPLTWFLAPALSLPGVARLGARVCRSLIARGHGPLPAV